MKVVLLNYLNVNQACLASQSGGLRTSCDQTAPPTKSMTLEIKLVAGQVSQSDVGRLDFTSSQVTVPLNQTAESFSNNWSNRFSTVVGNLTVCSLRSDLLVLLSCPD